MTIRTHDERCPRFHNLDATCTGCIEALEQSTDGKVYNVERSKGLHPQLLLFLDWWNDHGPHAIRIAGPERLWPWLPKGGVRDTPDDERLQLAAFKAGLSKARTLPETPHYPRVVPGIGRRGCAVDCHPIEFDPRIRWEAQPEAVKEKFAVYGKLGESRGLVWLGKVAALGGGFGDQPHLQIADWRKLRIA